MKQILKALVFLLFVHSNPMQAQNSGILRGVYLFGRSDVNFGQMKDSLLLNSFQTTTGFPGYETQDYLALHNYAGLKVYNQRNYLAIQSSAQRMVYEAEKDPSPALLWNYFTERQIGRTEGNARIAEAGVHLTGYMVKSAAPNDEYHYGDRGTTYYATFRLMVTGGSGTTQVADCIVYGLNTNTVLNHKQVLVSDLSPAGSYYDIIVQFSLNPGPTNPTSGNIAKMLTVGARQSNQSSLCTNIDLQVYWNGNVTTYLDKITVDDELAHTLFTGANDNAIIQDAGQFTPGSSFHDKFYLVDEPPISAFLGFNYVGNLIKNTLGDIPQAGTVAANYYSFQRFLTDGTPCQLMVDIYPFTSNIPHPSITNNSVADSAGIAHWDYNIYLSMLQSAVDNNFIPTLRSATGAAKQQSKPLIFIPQLHGSVYWQTHKYRDLNNGYTLRVPAPAEIRLSYNIGLAYGAKGFLPYPFGTEYWCTDYPTCSVPVAFDGLVSGRKYNGYYMDHWNNIDTIYGQRIWTGYKEKWDEVAALNSRLAQIGDTIIALKWIGAKSWSNSQSQTEAWSGIVTSVTTKNTAGTADPTPYVEVGNLQRGVGGTDYIVVVNRRCANEDTRDISITLNLPEGNWLMKDVYTGQVIGSFGENIFTDRFNPGEGKLYRIYKKIQLTSSTSTALASNSQRKLDYSESHWLAYESDNSIWLAKSTDGANTWLPESYIGEGSKPSISTAANSSTDIVFHKKQADNTYSVLWRRFGTPNTAVVGLGYTTTDIEPNPVGGDIYVGMYPHEPSPIPMYDLYFFWNNTDGISYHVKKILAASDSYVEGGLITKPNSLLRNPSLSMPYLTYDDNGKIYLRKFWSDVSSYQSGFGPEEIVPNSRGEDIYVANDRESRKSQVTSAGDIVWEVGNYIPIDIVDPPNELSVMALLTPDPGTPPPPKKAIFHQKRKSDGTYGTASSWSSNYDFYNPTVSSYNDSNITIMWESGPNIFRVSSPNLGIADAVITQGINPNLASNELRYAFLSSASSLYNLNVQPATIIPPPPPPPPPDRCPIDVQSVTASRSGYIQSGSDSTSLEIVLGEPKLFGGSCNPEKVPFETIDGSINFDSADDIVEYFKTKTFTINTTPCVTGESGNDSIQIHGKMIVRNPNGLIEPGNSYGKVKFELVDLATGDVLMRIGNEVALQHSSKIRFNNKSSIKHLAGKTVYIRPRFVGFPKHNLSGTIVNNYYLLSSPIGNCQMAKANLNDGNAEQTTTFPTEYSLTQNYPNPFNPTTVINY